MTEIPLPKEFAGRADQKGYLFKLVHREGDLCIYQKHKPEHKLSGPTFEVFFVQHYPEKRFPNGNLSPAREKPPSPEKWGIVAWSCPTLAAAYKKFDAVKPEVGLGDLADGEELRPGRSER